MSSEAVVKTVAKKLKYYFDVKRLEDGFDLSGVNCPQLDHPPLKSRPTLQYDGLHDRALKHYFSLPEVRVKLTQMDMEEKDSRQKIVKKKLKRHMIKHHFLLTRDPDVEPLSAIYGPPKSAGPRTRPSTLPEYAYIETREGRRLRRDMTGFGILMQSQRPKSLKGGWPLLRSVPTHNVPKSEAKRLVDAAAKVLIATESTEEERQKAEEERKRAEEERKRAEEKRQRKREKSPERPQSAPQPFEPMKKVDHRKFTWDIHGRRHRNVRSSYDNPYLSESSDFRSESPVPTPAPPPESPEPEPKKVRPRSAKRRYRQKTVIEVNESKPREEVSVNEGTQTMENGNQTDHQLLQQYNYLEQEVTSGERAEYQIYVKTGNRIGASTKAEVKITLYGEKGRTKEMLLEKSKRHKVCFQKGKEDLFIVAQHHVGKLLKVKIGHDRTDASNAWFLESVTVFDMLNKKIYEFVCERWLSGVDGDRKTYRELLVDRDRAFIQALEEESDTEKKSDRSYRKRSQSPASQGSLHDDPLSVRSNQGSYTDTKSDRKSKSRSSKRQDDSESDSESVSSYSSSSSSSSSGTYTTTATTTGTTTTTTTAKREKDELYDDPKGPTFTLRAIKKKGQRETVSVESSSQSGKTENGKEFVEGYETGLKAVEAEKRRKQEEENEERRRLLRGPTIHEAAERGNLNRIQELLTYFPEMKDHTNEQGLTPLHLAAKFGRVEILKWLAINEVNLNRETPQGYSPIHLAAMNGHVNCLMILHAMGAVITCRTLDKKTPLHLAAMNGHVECVKWLVANRSSMSVKDDMGRTPREIGEEFHHDDVVRFLKACEEELENPSSGFAQLRNPTGQGLPTIEEDSNSDEKPVWQDDNKAEDNEDSHSSQKEKEEKKHLYEETHKKMEQSGDSFLESIQREFESGPRP